MEFTDFQRVVAPFQNVSHETFIRLQAYVALLQQWQPKINLVSNGTLADVWMRHIVDSLQLCKHLPEEIIGLDFGSGAGFPGAVLSLVTGQPFTLVESDQRKSAFLLEVARVTGAPLTIMTKRVEALDPGLPATVVTARAFTALDKLLALSAPWLQNKAIGLFLKGASADIEVKAARNAWQFDCQTYPSISDPLASILVVSDLSPR